MTQREIAADIDIAKERELRVVGHGIEYLDDLLDVLVIRRNTRPHQAIGRWQPVEHIDTCSGIGLQETFGGEKSARAAANNRDFGHRHC